MSAPFLRVERAGRFSLTGCGHRIASAASAIRLYGRSAGLSRRIVCINVHMESMECVDAKAGLGRSLRDLVQPGKGGNDSAFVADCADTGRLQLGHGVAPCPFTAIVHVGAVTPLMAKAAGGSSAAGNTQDAEATRAVAALGESAKN